MNFEINKYLLNKMGWFDYSYSIGIGLDIGLNYSLFESDELVRFFIDRNSIKKCFVIKELSDREKQISNNLYKFIVVDYQKGDPVMDVTEFKSNEELFTMVINNEACNDEYQRHFKINKLLNK